MIRPLDYKIDTDPALLSRVIRNLVNNAFKYSDKEHPIVILAARPVGRKADSDLYLR